MVKSDDHPGIHPAIKKHYPGAVWQRCQRHFTVKPTDLVPKSRRDDVHQCIEEAWSCEEFTDAQAVLDKLAEDYQDLYPALSELISEHAWETLGVYYAAPPAHHRRLRTTNMLERVNQDSTYEGKRNNRGLRILQKKCCTTWNGTSV